MKQTNYELFKSAFKKSITYIAKELFFYLAIVTLIIAFAAIIPLFVKKKQQIINYKPKYRKYHIIYQMPNGTSKHDYYVIADSIDTVNVKVPKWFSQKYKVGDTIK